ncbi:MAG: M48 family metallopeptidase [Hyphomicrobiaceae bacterium]|nr:M48 family metallopeptidase [Hyphomicrobiaceae bacterium]
MTRTALRALTSSAVPPGVGLWRRLARRLAHSALSLTLAGAVSLGAFTTSASAQRRIPIIRDAEVEALMRDYAAPILSAAGLGRSAIEVVIVNDRDFNAFVADGRRIFINLGAILQSDTPGEVIGVLAHETGHLAGNHLARIRQELARAQVISAVAMLAGVAAVAAGAATGSRDVTRAGAGIVSGGGNVAARTLLAYQRGEELAADRAALTYLQASGQSARGMLTVFRRFAGQTMFSGRYVDPYVLSHPLPNDRIALVERLAQQSRYYDRPDPAELQLRHDLVRAKLIASLEGARTIARHYPDSDTTLPARYARAIAAGRFSSPREAARLFDQLIASAPSNPWFWEAKGQAMFEAGRAREAAEAYRRAIELAPDEPLIRVLYGAALVETGSDGVLRDAVNQLERGLRTEQLAIGFRFLGRAYSRLGDDGLAVLAAASEAFASGDIDGAKGFARRAQGLLARGSPGWLRAEDIITYEPPRL